MAGADILMNVAMDVSMVVGVGEGLRAAYVGAKIAAHVAVDVGEHAMAHAGEDAVEHVAKHEAEDLAEHVGESCAMSFAASTLVLTPLGARAIASLKVGDKVTAYDPQSGKSSTQTVEATTIHHDNNLVDVTLKVTAPATSASAKTAAPASKTPAQAAAATTKSATMTAPTEVLHTTANHPWLSADHGWLIASFLHVGEPVQRADGSTATVVAVRSVAGAADMWDLTVSQVHTFAIGAGQVVVHNACGPVKAGDSGRYGDLKAQAKQYGRDGNLEFHHMPSKNLFGVGEDDGWAIAVEDWEHAETRSFRGRGIASRAIDRAGTLSQAYMRDANDLRLITGTKYDDAIYKGFQYYQRLGLW